MFKKSGCEVIIGADHQIDDSVVIGGESKGKVTIGDNALIRSGSIVYSDVTIGNNLITGHRVLIREHTRIGDNVVVGTNVVIEGNCQVGNNVVLQTGTCLSAFTVVEDNVLIGPGVVVINDKYMVAGAKPASQTIQKGARIGANSTLLPGIVVGEDAIVGSGSVVTKDVPPKKTVWGNPARIRKNRKPEIKQ